MPTNLSAITNFLQLTERIGSAGQPTPDQFDLIKEAGYQAVINLAMPTSTNALPNEGSLVTRLGMSYFHIPVVWEHPQIDDFSQFLGVMQVLQEKKVFVHCALNMRASCFLFLYRVLQQKTPQDKAREAMGHIWQPDETWQRFITQVLAHYGDPTDVGN
jgi:protein tyrosine phosphatase (PTP) superfamily phosphohydrolase (DUF442 family)